MGSQTLEILRQGVWASLTGGWFYDPHQGVFCNVVHLYLWLFLLCSPFVAYLYFPGTWLTWCIYCILTSLTILLVKLANMALHRLYDRAQTMSEANLKNPFFKITKETEAREDETGIEMKVLGNDGSHNSIEQAINEASEENSMMSMENVNSIIDLKVDVHRKNSSESIELMFYAPSMMSANSQQDQQSIAGSASVSKSIRSYNNSAAAGASSAGIEACSKYLTVYPEHECEIASSSGAAAGGVTSSSALSTTRQLPHLLRKSSEEFKRRHQRRHQRLERQSSLDAAAASVIVSKLMRNQSDTIAAASGTTAARNETSFLHPQAQPHHHGATASFSKSASASKVNSSSGMNPTTTPVATNAQRLSNTTTTNFGAAGTSPAETIQMLRNAGLPLTKSTRLQRHRSSETHDERLKHQNRALFLPIHHEHHHHHVSSGASSSGALAAIGGGILDADEMELGMGGSASGVAGHVDNRVRPFLNWIMGSSSDVYIEDDSYTKSDFGIEQLDGRSSNNPNRSAFLLQQQQQLNSHYQHQQQYRSQQHHPHHHHHHGANIRKDSNSTMSELQLPIAAPPLTSSSKSGSAAGGGMKRRRHSNATALFKSGTTSNTAAMSAAAAGQQPTVRRIKSAALEISCPHPSVSNLSPHPNSVEGINGQQTIKNPQSALLPPPSKCLVRNAHLNLCPKFGDSLGSGSSLNFGSSTTALIDPVYPIVEQADEKTSLDLDLGEPRNNRSRDSSADLEIADIDDDDDEEDLEEEEDVHVDADNDDDDEEVNDVRMRRRHKALGCHDHSAESDVGDILADDDDEFKDFDDNLEHILNDLQQTHNQLDDLKASYAAVQHHTKPDENHLDDSDDDVNQRPGQDDDDDGPSTSQAVRQRLHSTDSETDNNGSRSPLLSAKNWEVSSEATKSADKAMRNEITAVQKHKQAANNFPQHLYEVRGGAHNAKGEGDSGCPSSDCEQISASSKDMLLSGIDTHEAPTSMPAALKLNESKRDVEGNPTKPKDIEEGGDSAARNHELPSTSAGASGKSLGAIPKVVKYREVDETRGGGSREASSASSQLHKRRGGSNNNSANGDRSMHMLNNSSTSKAASRTSSSTSSRSISADSFSADIHKMLWLMHGGAVDDRGRPIAGIGPDGAPIAANTNVVPPNMSTAHFQFYQDAIQALNTYPANSAEGLSLSERIYFRDKMRRSSKQISEPGNSSIGEFSHAHDLQSAQLSNTTSQGRTSHPPIGVVVASSSLNSRNVPNAATLSIQGLINVINDDRQARIAGPGTAAATLNVDAHIQNYCEYWRPACMLSAEKPVVPKSFYKYRCKFLGYEHEFKISMDRLELLALFDRDLHWLHILLSVILCGLVAYLGATILQHGYYKDIFAFVFCAVIAGSQYSLVKSVQPDAASPIHGFNKTVAYSRAIYFSLCGGVLLLFEQMKRDYDQQPTEDLVFFGVRYSPMALTNALLHIMYVVLLCFPLVFSLGLFPQVNTFLMYFLEQVDMHVFGGNAAGSLLGSFLCVLRSILGIMLLYGPLYAALAEGKNTQYIVFSIFCAMLIPLGYHLSRSASDFSHLWALIKTCIVSTYRDDDDELSATSASAASSQKLATSTPKRLKHARSDAGAAQTVSNENIEMSSIEKLPANERDDDHMTNLERRSSKSKASSLGSSSQTLGKTLSSSKKAMTASNSYASVGGIGIGIGIGGGGGGFAEGGTDIIIEQDLGVNRNQNEVNGQCDEAMGGATAVAKTINDSIAENADGDEAEAGADDDEDEKQDDDKVSTSSTTNPGDMSTLTAGGGANGTSEHDTESPDPLPKKLQNTVNTRLKNDLVVTTILCVVVLGLHCSTVFTVLQPDLNIVLYSFTGALGLILHYIIPQMRKHMPWLWFARPILRQKEFGQFEVSNAPKVMWFEKVYIYLCMVERNVLFPLLVISALTADAKVIGDKFGIAWGTLIVAVCALKFIRNAYSDPTNQYLIVMFTVFFFRIDFVNASETFLIDYFFVSLAFRKCCDFLLKLQFIVTYIAPWQITWGSAFHAFAQPFSVPHSAMLFLQAAVSAILSTPLNPFLGSAIFLTSYVRPIKFWERDYNTRRIDHSNTRLSSQLERDLGADDNNLNSIFYEHLTRSLQHSLCGDLLMGRWGNVNQGDCFVLASDYLNCLVHIIELGNGLCTFQMRGLEFRGTYCQQREVEAITEDVEDNDGCCCCDPGHLPRMLSANAMFSTRWLAWQVVAAQYVLEGYSISDNLASATLQVFEYRKVLITYYVKSIIFYVVKNPKLEQWLASGPIHDALQHTLSRQYVDLDPTFNYNLDEDFDFRAMGITRTSFCYVYLNWINFCCDKRKENQNPTAATPHTPAYNDSKSTPNLSSSASQAKSQSQQQLRARPQKSATMSGSATVNNHSTEHIATSQSFANISRQTSESAPGLTGAGITLGGYTSTATHATDNSFNHSSVTVGSSVAAKMSHGPIRTSKAAPAKPLRKEDSPTVEGRAASTESNRDDKPSIKLKVPTIAKDSPIVSLCLALGLLARRSLATASHSSLTGVEFFLHGLHALFKGDFRITSPRDEWVFADMELLHSVVAPAVKMALKLQQDHISNPDEFLDPNFLYDAIDTCSKDLVISHEADPVWRSAVLRGAPNLLALRHVMEDGSDEYRIIRLTKRFLSFRVIKLNRECVRGLWAGQQQELIYLRNRNPERGSIQNAKQALRNIINSSCDQPIGYPIYVSPLTTSYVDTNEQLREIIGGAITPESIKSNVMDWWHRIRERCRQGCSSGSAMETSNLGAVVTGPGCSAGGESGEIAPVYISAPLYNTLTVGNFFGLRPQGGPVASIGGSLSGQYGSDSLSAMRSGSAVMPVKPTSTTLLAGLLNRELDRDRDRETIRETMRESRGVRKSQTQSTGSSSDRERRATLPIASTSLGVVSGGGAAAGFTNEGAGQLFEKDDSTANNYGSELVAGSSPRYTKISCSSASLGIGNIITAPGEYPRKSKGPICLTAAAAAVASGDSAKASDVALTPRKLRFELYKKVIIVDETEIFDCLDLGRRIDVIWPNEEMRSNGGRLSWKDWEPGAGMVGYVVHYWIPKHADPRFRSHVNRIVYLIEIGDHYVPIGEYGLREYKFSSRRRTMQRDTDELRQQQQQLHQQREGLTPILGSSLESPTSQLASTSNFSDSRAMNAIPSASSGGTGRLMIRAVSSSSSESLEFGSAEFERKRHKNLLNMWLLYGDKMYGSREPSPEIEDFDAGEVDVAKADEVASRPIAEEQPKAVVESNNADNDDRHEVAPVEQAESKQPQSEESLTQQLDSLPIIETAEAAEGIAMDTNAIDSTDLSSPAAVEPPTIDSPVAVAVSDPVDQTENINDIKAKPSNDSDV